MNITEEFKKLLKNEEIDCNLLVPLMNWSSGMEKNIENVQLINKHFKRVNKKVLSHGLTLKNNVKHFIKYPKVKKEDEKLMFFYSDICKYFGWTTRELWINFNSLNLGLLKEVIAGAFGYDNKQRKVLKLQKLSFT